MTISSVLNLTVNYYQRARAIRPNYVRDRTGRETHTVIFAKPHLEKGRGMLSLSHLKRQRNPGSLGNTKPTPLENAEQGVRCRSFVKKKFSRPKREVCYISTKSLFRLVYRTNGDEILTPTIPCLMKGAVRSAIIHLRFTTTAITNVQ